jgi:hypothetical protein
LSLKRDFLLPLAMLAIAAVAYIALIRDLAAGL